jgi:hypothetical protein
VDPEEAVEGITEVGFDVVADVFGSELAVVTHERRDAALAFFDLLNEGVEGVDAFAFVGLGHKGMVASGGDEGLAGAD